MLAAVVSDLHLGMHSGADLLRRPDVQTKLFAGIADADWVVLLGDAIELRDGPLGSSLERARPFFEALGRELGGRRLTIVPGNHDHRLAEGVAPLVGILGGATVELAYPGLWIRDDVYATHGHYLDCHSAAATFESRASAVVQRVRRLPRDGWRSPADYEAALAPLYRLIHWGVQPPGIRAAAFGARRLVRSLERPRLEPGARARHGLPAMEQVVRNLGIEARHVLFGHLHAPGRWQTAAGVELVNTGSWVDDVTSVSPGTCVLVPNDGPPQLNAVLQTR